MLQRALYILNKILSIIFNKKINHHLHRVLLGEELSHMNAHNRRYDVLLSFRFWDSESVSWIVFFHI